MLVFSIWNTNIVLKARAILRAIPIATSPGAPSGRELFNSLINNSIIVKHIYNESANKIESCNVAFDTKDCWNFPLRCQGEYGKTLASAAHEIIWRRAYVA